MLTHSQKHDGNARGVHHADERADHVAHRVAFGDDEAVHAHAVIAELALGVMLLFMIVISYRGEKAAAEYSAHKEPRARIRTLESTNSFAKFLACATESDPTKASPTMKILSGLANWPNLVSELISLVSLCLLPAVSMSTTS